MVNRNVFWFAVLVIGIVLIVLSLARNNEVDIVQVTDTPQPTESLFPLPSATPTSLPAGTPVIPNPNGIFTGEPVSWELLPPSASCKLEGGVQFIDLNTYNNQDALFIYSGVGHPGDLIFWSVAPNDDLDIGPNIFSRMELPNGQSRILIILPENPTSKIYELTAAVQYRRLVDENGNIVTAGGNVKEFQTKCEGKTMINLP